MEPDSDPASRTHAHGLQAGLSVDTSCTGNGSQIPTNDGRRCSRTSQTSSLNSLSSGDLAAENFRLYLAQELNSLHGRILESALSHLVFTIVAKIAQSGACYC